MKQPFFIQQLNMHGSFSSDFKEMQPVSTHRLSTQKNWPPVQLFQHNYFTIAIMGEPFSLCFLCSSTVSPHGGNYCWAVEVNHNNYHSKMSFLHESLSGIINRLKRHPFSSFKPIHFLFQFYVPLVRNTVLYSVATSIIHHYHCSEVTSQLCAAIHGE